MKEKFELNIHETKLYLHDKEAYAAAQEKLFKGLTVEFSKEYEMLKAVDKAELDSNFKNKLDPAKYVAVDLTVSDE